MNATQAHVIAVEPDCVIVEAAGRRRRAAMSRTDDVRPGDWVLIEGGSVVTGAATCAPAGDIAFDGDLVDERHHYPTEDPDTAPPVLHHPPIRSTAAG